ncbi:MAG: hypothetical protein ABIU63_12285 [Chitinophagaceae bacterium]
MITRKAIWTVILSVCAFTAVYLYYVKKERTESVKNYFSQPRVGDIYKLRKDTREGVTVFYLKIKDVGEQSIYFYPGRLQAGALHDSFLKHFDTTETEVYTKKELAEIVGGQWKTARKDETELIEIERK